MVVGVTDPSRNQLTLYRIGADRRAEKLQVIRAPAWADQIDQVQLDDRPSPGLCLLFRGYQSDPWRNETWCFEPGSRTGYRLPLDGMFRHALSSSGSVLVSLSHDVLTEPTGELAISDRSGTTSTRRYTASIDTESRPGDCSVVGVAWAGGPDLVVDCAGADESPDTYRVQRISSLKTGASVGAGTRLRPSGPLAKGYDWFSHLTVLDDNTAIAIMTITYHCGEHTDTVCSPDLPKPKAVRVDLQSGEVLEVVAFAATGRSLRELSGGSHGLVYATEGGSPSTKRVYVRWPGEAKGQVVSGLPGEFDNLVAQH